jgi:hypothetical protein
MSNPFSAESPKNYEQKCTVALVLDISGSMSEHNRLVNMVKGLDAFICTVGVSMSAACRSAASAGLRHPASSRWTPGISTSRSYYTA